MIGGAAPQPATPPVADARARLTALSARLDAALAQRITHDRARLTALSHRMEAAQPNPAAA
jgi:exonuclease VII large subunit